MLFCTHLIKVSYDFVEEPQALHVLVVELLLFVIVSEPWDGSKQHPNPLIGLGVQVLENKREKKINRAFFSYIGQIQIIDVTI